MKKLIACLLMMALLLAGSAIAEENQRTPWGQSETEMLHFTSEGPTLYMNGREIRSYEAVRESDEVMLGAAAVSYALTENYIFYLNQFVGTFYDFAGEETPYLWDLYPFSFDDLKAKLQDGGNERVFTIAKLLMPYGYSSAEAISGCKIADMGDGIFAGCFNYRLGQRYFVVNEQLVLQLGGVLPAETAAPVAEDPAEVVSTGMIDEMLMQQVLDAIGPDLMARGKAAGFLLSIRFDYFEDLSDPDHIIPQIYLELRSADGSTWPKNVVDWELMHEIQCAALNVDLFGLQMEEYETLKGIYYSPSSDYFDSALEMSVDLNMHINETPSYEAYLRISHPDQIKYNPNCGKKLLYSSYTWDELQFASER